MGICGVIEDGVADIAVISNGLAGIAYVLSVMATEAAREIEMTDVVGMRLPVGLHLRKEIRTEYSLDLFDRPL